jgi:hypothetical protein
MSKRFTDTNIWDQTWFLELSPEGKNIWQFLEKSSDCAGIWKIDIPEMRRKIGYKDINLANFLEEVNRDYNRLTGEPEARKRIIQIANNTKLWLTGFISFQYEKGTSGVNAGIPAIKGALNRLRDENIYEYALKEGFVRVKGESGNANKNENLPINNINDINSFDHISDSENYSKGCRGSARDKDKDKDQDQEEFVFKDLNKEAGEEGNVKGEPDSAQLLFVNIWSKPNKLPEEKRLLNEYIIKYGLEAVEFAFREGVKYNKMSLAYVDAICRKKKEKAELAEYKDREKKKLHENMLRAEEQRKSGQCLTLMKDVYG